MARNNAYWQRLRPNIQDRGPQCKLVAQQRPCATRNGLEDASDLYDVNIVDVDSFRKRLIAQFLSRLRHPSAKRLGH